MPKTIPALKSPADKVPQLVVILYDFAREREEVNRRIIELLREISRASERNLLKAYAAPTLNNLGFAIGEGKTWRCSPDGESLARAYKESESVGLKRFGYLLYQYDEVNGLRVLAELQHQKADRVAVSRKILGEILFAKYNDDLIEQGITLKMLLDRLSDWLSYLAHVQFVGYSEGDSVRLFPFEIQAALVTEATEWEQDEFRSSLFKAYAALRTEHPSWVYVPLPDVRQKIYELAFKNQNRAFSSVTFDDVLRRLPKATDDYVILLSPPGSESGGGLRIGDKYYYYISIHEHRKKGRNND
jgi:hypothetical protein